MNQNVPAGNQPLYINAPTVSNSPPSMITQCDGPSWLSDPTDPNPCPVDAFPPGLYEPTVELIRNTNAPPGLVVACVLGVLSLVGQSIADVKRPIGTVSPISLFIIALAEANDRKTTVDKLLTQMLRELEAKYGDQYQADMASYQRDLDMWATKLSAMKVRHRKLVRQEKENEAASVESEMTTHHNSKPNVPMKRRFLYDNINPSSLLLNLNRYGTSAALLTDEGDMLLNGHGMRDLALINKSWDGSELSVDRVDEKKSFTVRSPRLTISAQIQPGLWDEFIKKRGKKARDIGGTARMLICHPKSLQGDRFLNSFVQSWMYRDKLLKRFVELHQQGESVLNGNVDKLVLELNQQSKVMWTEFYNYAEGELRPGGTLFDTREYAGKVAENVVRVAALFHLFQGRKGEITEDTFSRARRLMTWFVNEYRRLLGDQSEIAPTVVNSRRLEDWLVDCALKHGTTDIAASFIGNRTHDNLRHKDKHYPLLHALQSANRVQLAFSVVDERRIEVVRVLPHCFSERGWYSPLPSFVLHLGDTGGKVGI